MAKELMEIGGFITSGAEIVNHDASLSGNGTVDSPLGLNETVLWETTGNAPVATAALSESLSKFEYFKLHLANGTSIESRQIHMLDSNSTMWNVSQGYSEQGANPANLVMVRLSTNGEKTELSALTRKIISFGNWNASPTTISQSYSDNPAVLLKVVGINRKAQ